MNLRVVASCPWIRPEKPGAFQLVEGQDFLFVRPGARFVTYDPPTDVPDLACRFAALDGSDEGFRAFADEFGFLFTGWRFGPDEQPVPRESFERLQPWHDARAVLAHFTSRRDRATEATDLCLALVNSLRPGETPQSRPGLWSAVTVLPHTIQTEGGGQSLALGITVPDLERAISLRYCLDIIAGRRWVQCEGCGKWMDLAAPGEGRSDRRTCSPACRSRVFRRRRKESA